MQNTCLNFANILQLVLLALLAGFTAVINANENANATKDTAQEILVFNHDQMRTRYYALIGELRCPKCQNQNLADSDAPIAADLRQQLHRLLQEDYSDKEILDFMTTRYGSFVLYKPPLNEHTLAIWLLPACLFVIGCLFIYRNVTAKRKNQFSNQDVDKQVENLLKRLDRDN